MLQRSADTVVMVHQLYITARGRNGMGEGRWLQPLLGKEIDGEIHECSLS